MINILFICMGNICRSPTAEGFFARAVQNSMYKDLISIDSAGTHSYHLGYEPDSRAVDMAAKFGVEIGHLRARKVKLEDFQDFDLIIAMDRSNYSNLQAIQPGAANASLKMMMEYHPQGQPEEVPDPYYGAIDGFNYMCELLDAATAGLLRDVEDRLGR